MCPTRFQFIWPSGFRGEDFYKSAYQKEACLWRPCLLTDRDKRCNLHRGPSIDASYQVSVHLAKGIQRRRLKCEMFADDRLRTPSDGKSSHCLWHKNISNHSNLRTKSIPQQLKKYSKPQQHTRYSKPQQHKKQQTTVTQSNIENHSNTKIASNSNTKYIQQITATQTSIANHSNLKKQQTTATQKIQQTTAQQKRIQQRRV